MTTRDNAPPREGWRPPPRFARHCGVLQVDIACEICGEFIKPPANDHPSSTGHPT